MKFHSINCRGRLIDLTYPKIMGIVNLTPDSFSDGGQYFSEAAAVAHAGKLISEGASILDIGAQSTRPSAHQISAAEERFRLKTILPKIREAFPDILISLDTFWSDVVKYGFDEGIDLVNDISAGQFDKAMFKTVAETGLPYILMHSNSAYETMHDKIIEGDSIVEINKMMRTKSRELLDLGVTDMVWDPGFGFGKTIGQQLKIIEDFDLIGFGDWPMLAGISRKSFIYKPLGKKPLDINNETQKLHAELLRKGARILRVHDVEEARKTIEKFMARTMN